MGMRTGSTQFMTNYSLALNNAYQKQAKLFEQADGSSIHRASDNPMNYYKLLRYNISDSENTQYRDNIKTASGWMKNSDSVMVHMTEIMKTMKEKSVAAADSYNSEDDYAALAKEMMADMQELVSVANTQYGDRYLFSGQKDLIKPFEMSPDTYDRGLAKTLDTSQATFFKGTDSDYNTELFQMLELERDGKTYYLDTASGNLFTKDFVDSGEHNPYGYKSLVAKGYNTIEEATQAGAVPSGVIAGTISDFKVSDYFTSQGLINDGVENRITISDNEYTFKTMKQNIVTYKGDENLISMVKLNGATDPTSDTVNSTGARMFGRDIFDNAASGNKPSGTAMLNNLFCVYSKVESCDTHWMSSDGVTVCDVAHATLVVEETRIGARQQLYEGVEAMLEVQGDNITEDITNVSGADIAQLATQLMQMTALYNMSLSLGGRILPPSLADYL